MSLDIRPDHLKIVEEILKKHLPDREVWAFGSRVNGTAKETSDLDLVVIGENPLDFQTLGALRDDFSESNLPYKVDVVDWAKIGETFREIIRKDKVVIRENGFSDSELPYSSVKLSEVATITMGQSPPGSTYNEIGIGAPFYQGVTDFGSRHPLTRVFCSAPTRMALKGDILLSVRAPIGRVNISTESCAVGRGLAIIRGNNSTDTTFLEFYLRTLKDQWDALESQGSVFGNAKKEDLEKLLVVWPNSKIRRSIVNILGTLDDKIELNRRMNETLEAMAQALFKSWFVDFDPVRAKMEGRPTGLPKEIEDLFPDSFEDSELGEIPRGWEVGGLADITELQNGYAFKSSDWVENGIPVIKIGSVRPGFVDIENVTFITESLANTKVDFRLYPGDILVGLTGYVGEIGKIPPSKTFPILNQRVARFKPKSVFNGLPLSGYIYSCVRDPAFKKFAEEKSHGSAQANVSTKDLLKYNIILGNKEVFLNFEKITIPIFQMILNNFGEIKKLMSIRSLLLPKLLSGEVKVSDIPPLQRSTGERQAK